MRSRRSAAIDMTLSNAAPERTRRWHHPVGTRHGTRSCVAQTSAWDSTSGGPNARQRTEPDAPAADQPTLHRELLKLSLRAGRDLARQTRAEPAARAGDAGGADAVALASRHRRREHRAASARAGRRCCRRVRHGRAVRAPARAAGVLPRPRPSRGGRWQLCVTVPAQVRRAGRHGGRRRGRVPVARVLPRVRGRHGAAAVPRDRQRRPRRFADAAFRPCCGWTATTPRACSSRAAARTAATSAT